LKLLEEKLKTIVYGYVRLQNLCSNICPKEFSLSRSVNQKGLKAVV